MYSFHCSFLSFADCFHGQCVGILNKKNSRGRNVLVATISLRNKSEPTPYHTYDKDCFKDTTNFRIFKFFSFQKISSVRVLLSEQSFTLWCNFLWKIFICKCHTKLFLWWHQSGISRYELKRLLNLPSWT